MDSEVRGLEFEIARLLTKLDLLLRECFEIGYVPDITEGFHVNLPQHLPQKVRLEIYPVGWPKEWYVCASFYRKATGDWEFSGNGVLYAHPIGVPFWGLNFKPEHNWVGLKFEPNESQKPFVVRSLLDLSKELGEYAKEIHGK